MYTLTCSKYQKVSNSLAVIIHDHVPHQHSLSPRPGTSHFSTGVPGGPRRHTHTQQRGSHMDKLKGMASAASAKASAASAQAMEKVKVEVVSLHQILSIRATHPLRSVSLAECYDLQKEPVSCRMVKPLTQALQSSL